MEALRVYSRTEEIPLSGLSLEDEPVDVSTLEESDDLRDLWEMIRHVVPNERERLLAYLIFVCNLKPMDIVRYGPKEFSDLREVYRLKRHIQERLVRNMDQFRSW